MIRVPPVLTPRLALVSIPESVFRDLLAHRTRTAEGRLRIRLPDGFAARAEGLLRLRLGDLERDPGARPWLLRVVALRSAGAPGPSVGAFVRPAVGLVGFHGRPDREGRVEIGYEIFPPYRRRGYAREAVTGLLDWAARRHGIRRFLAAIAPDNEPSMRLALGLGFRQVGAQVDEDGLEFVYELTVGS